MDKDFSKKIDAVKRMAITAKEQKKKKIIRKVMEALELCKQHGGPLKMNDKNWIK